MKLRVAFFSAFLLGLGLSGLSAQGMELFSGMKRALPRSGYQYLSDPGGNLALEEIIGVRSSSANRWRTIRNGVISPGYSRGVHWVKLEAKNSAPVELEYYVVQMFTGVSHYSVYSSEGKGRFKIQRSGEVRKQKTRKIPHTIYAFPVIAPPISEGTLYLRYHSHASLNISPTFYSPQEFHSSDNGTFYGEPIVWLYYGFLIIMVFYNSIVFLIIKSKSHFYYTMYLVFLALTVFTVFGQSFLYLWPDSSHWNLLSYHVFPNLTMFALLLFARHFINMKAYTRVGDMLINFLAWINFAIACMMLFNPDIYLNGPVGAAILMLSNLPLMALIFYIAVFKKSRQGVYLGIALSLFLISLSLLVVQSLFKISLNANMINSLLMGSSLEVVILSLGLADQFRVARKKAYQAERRYRYFVENSADLIFTLDSELRIKSFNEAMEMRLGYPAEELCTKRLTDLFFVEMVSGISPDRLFSGELVDNFLKNRRPLVFTRALSQRFGLEPKNYLIKLEYVRFNSSEVILGHAAEHIGDSLANLPYRETITYVTDNTYSKLDYISERLTENLVRFFRIPDVLRIRNGLREALMNAMEHGNLSITQEEKERAIQSGSYRDLLSQRRGEPERADRRIKVECRLYEEGVVYQIFDEGQGFDYESTLKLYESNPAEEVNKRGLALISGIFDVVEFRGVGNQLMLSKKFPGRGTEGSGVLRND